MFMEFAQTAAKRSTCMRLNVGAVMVHSRSVVSIGYNGPPSGEPHCQGNGCPGRDGCHLSLHAEHNALLRVPPGIKGGLDLYVTDSPCAVCYDLLASSCRVGRIFFGTPYRITDHLLNSLWDIPVYRITPAGYTIDWETKEVVDVET
jgi:dCMP deaminase